MGQDSEEAAEFVATVRRDHVVMKTWYMGDSPAAKALQERHGPYPGLWKEVLNWKGWKEARKEYLKHQQKEEKSSGVGIPRKRKSRWGILDDEPAERKRQDNGRNPLSILPSLPSNLPPQKQDQLKQLQSKLRTINTRLDNVEREAARIDNLPRGHRERSPSPPPVYGPDGKRQNTRAVRWRERYSAERQDVLEKIMNLNPVTRNSGLLARKRTTKVPIPIEKHPNYNFIGLIIGPRGKTQKELESKTGCKIAVRGRGSIKEGARGRRDGRATEGEGESLHVLITGESQQSVEAAAKMIEDMLIVIDDEKNVHKQQQLRELALLNGTLKEQEFCPICAEKGHRAFECPKRFANKEKQSLSVKCAICGDTSHPTRDCRMKPTEQKDSQQLDSDYMNFMAELDGRPVQKEAPPNANGAPPPPQAAAPPPPLPTGGPPGAPPPPNLDLPPPPPLGLPPPPVHMPPPPVAQNFSRTPGKPIHGKTAQPYQQQGYPSYDPFYYQQGGQAPPVAPGYPPQPAPGQQQQPPQVPPGQETQEWDPSAYYSYDANGAGGLNWWEQ